MDDAANAAVPDVEDGGGANAVAMEPCPADPRHREPQPFTGLRAAPYVAGMLGGAAMFGAGLMVAGFAEGDEGRHGEAYRDIMDHVGTALYSGGLVLASASILVAAWVSDGGGCGEDLPRFEPD